MYCSGKYISSKHHLYIAIMPAIGLKKSRKCLSGGIIAVSKKTGVAKIPNPTINGIMRKASLKRIVIALSHKAIDSPTIAFKKKAKGSSSKFHDIGKE